MPQIILTCPPGFEYPLVDEALSLGAESAREGLTQVMVEADWPAIYRICLWSRLANRVLLVLKSFDAENEEQLYDECNRFNWELHFDTQHTFAVDFVSRRSKIDHQQYGALKIKDAIVDYFRGEFGDRPSVSTDQPDVRVHCRINKNQATLCLDLAGTGLHQRGYREEAGAAPLRENMAALMLERVNWRELSKEGQWFYDPMCGAGTIAIEAALVALDKAPGLSRSYWGFHGWKLFHKEIWEKELQAAQLRFDSAKAANHATIYASDKDPKVIEVAQRNAERAGVAEFIKFNVGEFQSINASDLLVNEVSDSNNESSDAKKCVGVIVTNPPYGERLETKTLVEKLYADFGLWLKQQFSGAMALILSADKNHGHALGIRAKKIYRLKNGPIDCELLKLELKSENFIEQRKENNDFPSTEHLSDAASALLNRLKKNYASLKSFLKQQDVSCYRLYDADLPDYAAAIDVYDGAVHIQEYAAPKTVEPRIAMRRLKDIEKVTAIFLECPLSQVFTKTRTRQKGDSQYTKQNQQGVVKVVEEGAAKFEVNLTDYLDTGLFLDHRKARALLASWTSPNQHLLNMFSYTCCASIPSALKGVKTTNVDMSNTYLDWGRRNFQLNNVSLDNHSFVRANCLEWLEMASRLPQRYQTIFIDPPTFSNSKKMDKHFDVQSEHVSMLQKACLLLAPGGKLLFSNNFRKFKMEFESSELFNVKEITKQTTSRDFLRKPLHRSWLIEHNK